jgi:hypothetical protein
MNTAGLIIGTHTIAFWHPTGVVQEKAPIRRSVQGSLF